MDKKIRVIVIDAQQREVHEAQVPKGSNAELAALHSLVDGYIQVAHRFDNGDVLYVDEDGLAKGLGHFFCLVGQTSWIAGSGVIVGTAGSCDCNAKSSVRDIRRAALFAELAESQQRRVGE